MKRFFAVFLAASLAAVSLVGCGGTSSSSTTTESSSVIESTVEESESTTLSETESTENESTESSSEESESASLEADTTAIRVGALKGPTSMGLVGMMDNTNYDFAMVTAADELLAKMVSNELDIALVPANVASVLYNKTSNVSVIDINTLGVLYIVAADTSLQSIPDLKGKTLYMTGKGTTPDYVFQYLLQANVMSASDLTIEYKSEAAEVAALLKEQPDAIGLLPQPFATVACVQNESLQPVIDLTEQWDALQGEGGSRLVTGVTIVRNDFLNEQPEAVNEFMRLHKESAAYVNENPAEAAEKIVELGIVEKAPIAQKALPYCNITYIDGEEMKEALSGYLTVLFEQDASSVGGQLPDDAFYYLP